MKDRKKADLQKKVYMLSILYILALFLMNHFFNLQHEIAKLKLVT